MIKSALFSPCRTYRYSLHRVWNPKKPLCAFIGLNPSTADEQIEDNTVTRCMGFAGSWGYGGLVMLNIFAYRSTDPKGLLIIEDPVGPENDMHLVKSARKADLIVCAWGYFPKHSMRAGDVFNMLGSMHALHHLGLTKEGWPRHPLYIRKDVKPEEWRTER